jgi:primosomal protein N' (replication factor Y)
MDSDTTSRKGTQEKILQALEQRKIDILIGTQMITKGHDFPFITLVGVISADTALNMPDFRAAERTFQLITQVAGRGGRGETPGKVIIQTFNPDHYALRHAQNHDYKSFYTEEIDFRKALQYPPFGRIINLRLSSIKKDALIEEAQHHGQAGQKTERAAWKYCGNYRPGGIAAGQNQRTLPLPDADQRTGYKCPASNCAGNYQKTKTVM